MSGFTGFSEIDIRKVQNGETSINKSTQNLHQSKQSSLTNPKKVSSENRNKNLLNEKLKINGEISSLSEQAKLSPVTECRKQEETVEEVPLNEAEMETEVKEFDVGRKDIVNFQTKQKLMEEQNRVRKEMLSKALAVRTKQTLEEQRRLDEVRAEFKKIDDSLSNDVKILRKQIETASLEYMEAQKQFDRKEKEYLQAKLFLHSRLEQKELLTEHLQTIIEKNEERKAKKLTELLLKLDCLQNGVGTQSQLPSNPSIH